MVTSLLSLVDSYLACVTSVVHDVAFLIKKILRCFLSLINYLIKKELIG